MKPGVIWCTVTGVAYRHRWLLNRGLKSGRLGGVALDVYEEDKKGCFSKDLSGEGLFARMICWRGMLTFPNVLIKPTRPSTHESSHEHCRRHRRPICTRLMQETPFVGGSYLT